MYNMRGRRKGSIIKTVLIINLGLTLIHFLIFMTLAFSYRQRIQEEKETYVKSSLEKVVVDVDMELQRLDGLMELCINEPSIVLSIVNRIDYQEFLNYKDQAATNLSMIRYALPYSKQLFLYSKQYDMVVRDNAATMDGQSFLNALFQNSDTVKEEFYNMEDGLHVLNGNIFYAKNYYSYGLVVIQIDANKFKIANQIVDGDENVFVFNPSGEGVIINKELGLTQKQLSLMHKGIDEIKIHGKTYLCYHKTSELSSYHSVRIVEKTPQQLDLSFLMNVTGIAFVMLLISAAVMLWVNVSIYLPLKKISRFYGNVSNENEYSFIENKIQNLVKEVDVLKETRKTVSTDIPNYAALQYLLGNEACPEEMNFAKLEEKYQRYDVVAFALQDENGKEPFEVIEELKKSMEKLGDMYIIPVKMFVYAMVIAREEEVEIAERLYKVQKKIEGNWDLYLGFNENCTDIAQLKTQFSVAHSNLLQTIINRNEKIHHIFQSEIQDKKGMKSAIKNQLMEYGIHSDAAAFMRVVKSILTREEGITLVNYRELYLEIANILETIVYMNKVQVTKNLQRETLYNTKFMYRQIQEYAEEMGAKFSTDKGEMENQILAYIHKNLTMDLSLESVADAFAITPVYLSSWFKKTMGVNFLAYISKERMIMARKILMENQKIKVYEVSKSVGIENTATFIRQFKSHFGITPEQFRKQYNSGMLKEDE